ncbi:MAG: AAA family ATPase [Gemmatimonadetes bacterium]|nr:AAA family ATPase [Gemmatimonadota bacterium]MYG85694.1 AAA family ATPase [Gemmatimonadota bacterium]MYJ90150.1 AAA family ATPase [Gemmatimonadota bacterium]
MPFHADLHLHSHYSRATSKNLNLEHLYKWAQLKGIRVVGTGDFVHPGWMDELEEKLQPAEEGLFRLKPEFERTMDGQVPAACRAPVRFMLTVEISNIYKRLGRVRKVHNIILAPGFEAAKSLQARLGAIGNIRSDGRPILGLDSRDLLEITLETDPMACLIPAHVWTPWFSALGSRGGFDRISDCYGDLTEHIFAVETGLSSDPLMNWRLEQLDPYVLVSNSDAHSPGKLGRETTLFDTSCDYPAIYSALSDPEDEGLTGTVEFYPEEGKYHYDGHRKCERRMHPRETIDGKGLCPDCGKPVTVGVMARVEALADREEGKKPPRARHFFSVIPLPEIIGEAKQVGPATKTVDTVYQAIVSRLGSELDILLDIPEDDIAQVGGTLIAEGIRRMRIGEVDILPGYDGDYGVIKLFNPEDRLGADTQIALLEDLPVKEKKRVRADPVPDDTPEMEEEDTPVVAETSPVSTNGKAEVEVPAPTVPKTTASADPAETGPDGVGPVETNPDAASPVEADPAETGPDGAGPSVAVLEALDAPEDATSMSGPLNEDQQKAVTHREGHLLIVAGPGTGKTHTLTHRMAYLARHETTPGRMLAVTFTNKAAGELKARLGALLDGQTGTAAMVGTFHGICLALMRQWSRHASIPFSLSVATPDDQERLARAQWPLDNAVQLRRRLEEVARWKASGRSGEIPEAVSAYTRLLRRHGLLDFDDVILETTKLLRSDERFRQNVHERFHYVLVDEYQDINPAQHDLLKILVEGGARMTAIGDPNQAIYGFRGADTRYFHSFEEDFPGAEVRYLSENYRSAANLLDASSQVMRASGASTAPPPVAALYVQGRLVIRETRSDRAEAEYVVHQIERMVGGTSHFSQDSGRLEHGADPGEERSFGDIAVLYRVNSQHTALVEAFERSGIPYRVAGDTSLINRPGVQEIVTLLQLGDGRTVTTGSALRCLSSTIDGLGDRTVELIEELWKKRNQITIDHVRELMDHPRLLMKRSRNGVEALLSDLKTINTDLEKRTAGHILENLARSSIWDKLKWRYPRADDSLRELARYARIETELPVMLDKLLLSQEYDAFGEASEHVNLMTLHAAKGLEFPVVFVVGCEDGLVPLQHGGEASNVDEERRLFYVAMTRAKEHLYLVRSGKRMLFGEVRATRPSPFLTDIEEQLKQYDRPQGPHRPDRRRKKAKSKPTNQLSLFG